MLPQPVRAIRAATALAATTRCLSSSSSSSASHPNASHPDATPSWPLLKRRSRTGSDSLIEYLKSRQDPAPAPAPARAKAPEPAPAPRPAPAPAPTTPDAAPPNGAAAPTDQRDPRVMLSLRGLSPSLKPSDFYRLAPSDLSSWQSVITKIEQQRDPITLEPLGQYHISFATAPAAISYRDRLLRLHRLSHHRLTHAHGLWESLVPLHLR
ncbi:hypothetical protein E4U41_002502, partial [Claviceps citrina]